MLDVSHTQLINHRVQVFWDGEQQWFTGRVTRYEVNDGRHAIRYDDGEVAKELLLEQAVRLERRANEPLPPPPTAQHLQKLVAALRAVRAPTALRGRVRSWP